MARQKRKVAVIGGGITGLSAAYYLKKQAAEKGLAVEITLIEAAHRLGGKIQTLRKDGLVIERGPDSFVSRKPAVAKLAEDLGISGELVSSAPGISHVAIEDWLLPLPKGSIMGVPASFRPFLTSGICSWSGKFRAAGDFILPKTDAEEDQPLGRYLRRRFGNELVESMVEPLFSGVYAGDIDRLSMKSAFPELYKAGQNHRSVIKGLRDLPVSRSRLHDTKATGVFQTFRGGLETLVSALEAELSDCTILRNVKVKKVQKNKDQLFLELNNGSVVSADGAVFAIPHSKLLPLFKPFGLLEDLKKIPSTSIATISMAFPENTAFPKDDVSGFVVARNSEFTVTACSAAHLKWPSRNTQGKLLFRAFVGRVGNEAVVELSDSEIEKMVLADLKKILQIDAKPEFTVVSRWKEAMPQYLVGHEKRIEAAKRELHKEFPMVQLAGSSFEGFGLPACVSQGKAAAGHIVDRLLAD